MMQYGWNDCLRAFKVDPTTGGGADFAELLLRLVNGWRWTGQLPQIGGVVRTMAAERGCDTQALYREMKKAVAPMLESDPAALRLWELEPTKMTSSGLAAALAAREVALLEQHGSRYLPDKTITHKGARGGKRK